MNCPDKKVLQQWAEEGPNGMDFAAFLHLCYCTKCRSQWQEEVRYLIYDEYTSEYAADPDDIEMIKTFLMKKQDENRWIQMRDKIAQLCKLEQVDFSLWSQSFAGMSISQMAASGENAYRRLYSADKAELVIVFSANCSKTDPYYWMAMMTFPSVVSSETILSFFIEDSREEPILAGKFVLFDQELMIEDGIAEITFEEFLKNLNKHSVKLIYPDETVLTGTLKYF